MRIIELILDEDLEFNGVDAISIVESPAIQSNFVALKDQSVRLAEVNKDKRILLGAVLIPNKPILRNTDSEDYYIYFSKETVQKASQMYLRSGNQNNTSLEHQYKLNGLTLVESWIVDNEIYDKSRMYENTKNVPVGTWMGAVKVNDEKVWDTYVKEGIVHGFSIEGYFADKAERPKESIDEMLEDTQAKETLSEIEKIIARGLF
jgi:glutaredoxin-related protein